MRSKHKCTQLTRNTSSFDIYISFRMNATKEHTQLHTTYSRCIILQALFYLFFSPFFFFFLSPHPLLKSKVHEYYDYSFPKVKGLEIAVEGTNFFVERKWFWL